VPLLDRQRGLEREYEAAQEDLARADPRDAARLSELRVHLIRLRGERSGLAARIARASLPVTPRSAIPGRSISRGCAARSTRGRFCSPTA